MNLICPHCAREINLLKQNAFKPLMSRDQVFSLILEETGFTEEELKEKNRKEELIEARAYTYYVMREYCDMSLPAIGDVFGLDHTTIINALRRLRAKTIVNGRVHYAVSRIDGKCKDILAPRMKRYKRRQK